MGVIASPTTPLYKFLSLAEGQSPTWQERLDLLLAGRCYLSSAADFNDPFDCLPYIDCPTDPVEYAAWSEGMIHSLAEAVRKDLPAGYVRDAIRRNLAGRSLSDITAALQEAAQTNASKMGVFCLAERLESVLMWSHYASNHTGVALQLEFRHEPDSQLLPLWKVSYQDDRPVLRDVYSDQPATPLADALATKAAFWSYEQEWRAMKPDRAGEFVRFDPSVVTGLVMGANCRGSAESAARDRAAQRGIPVFRMKPDAVSFRLRSMPAD